MNGQKKRREHRIEDDKKVREVVNRAVEEVIEKLKTERKNMRKRLDQVVEETINYFPDEEKSIAWDSKNKNKIKSEVIKRLTREVTGEEINKIAVAFQEGDSKGEFLVEPALKVAYLCKEKGMTTSQIRHLYQEVQRIKPNENNENLDYKINQFRYKLAYTVGRHEEVELLQLVAEAALKNVSKENWDCFRHLFEAIVAYHRYLGGKE